MLVRSPDADRLADLIAPGGKAMAQEPSDGQAAALSVTGLERRGSARSPPRTGSSCTS